MTHGYEQVPVETIRGTLRDTYGVEEKVLKQTKGKLVELLLKLEQTAPWEEVADDMSLEDVEVDIDTESLLDDVEELVDDTPETIDVGAVIESENDQTEDRGEEKAEVDTNNRVAEDPIFGSLAWTDFVLGMLEDDEMTKDKHPTCAGLRRVTDMIIGPCFSQVSHIKAPGAQDGVATVVVEVTCVFHDRSPHPLAKIGQFSVVLSDVSDCGSYNTPEPYCQHQSGTAMTKAEGRCYRKLLQLRKVITAEEAGTGDFMPDNQDEPITEMQIQAIDVVARRNNISVADCLALSNKKRDSVREMSEEDGTQVAAYITDIGVGRKDKPESVGSYDPDWNKE
jgi:hypothetical protein